MSLLSNSVLSLCFHVMLPLMLACITGFVIAQRIRPDSVYAKSLASNRIARETLKAAPVPTADNARDS